MEKKAAPDEGGDAGDAPDGKCGDLLEAMADADEIKNGRRCKQPHKMTDEQCDFPLNRKNRNIMISKRCEGI
ncbi:hypothetical protein GCM10023067_59100 [Aminobacter aganoensis]